MPPANNSLLLPNIVIASLPYAAINSHVGMCLKGGIVSGNVFATNRRKSITWANDAMVHWEKWNNKYTGLPTCRTVFV